MDEPEATTGANPDTVATLPAMNQGAPGVDTRVAVEDDEQTGFILERLELQYRLYREEFRAYIQVAGASASILVLLLFGELAAAKDNPTLYLLVPLSILSYGAFFANAYASGQLAVRYSELMEQQINSLLPAPLFRFESKYIGIWRGRDDAISFIAFAILIALFPLAASAYALLKLGAYHRTTALLLAALVVAGVPILVWSLLRITRIAKEKNDQLMAQWPAQLEKLREIRPDSPTRTRI